MLARPVDVPDQTGRDPLPRRVVRLDQRVIQGPPPAGGFPVEAGAFQAHDDVGDFMEGDEVSHFVCDPDLRMENPTLANLRPPTTFKDRACDAVFPA